jgi:hypothetical protein
MSASTADSASASLPKTPISINLSMSQFDENVSWIDLRRMEPSHYRTNITGI